MISKKTNKSDKNKEFKENDNLNSIKDENQEQESSSQDEENIINKDINDNLNSENKDKEENQYEEIIAELKNQLLLEKAESENIRKRYENQLKDTRKYAISNFIKDLLPALDNLTMALMHQPKNPTEELKNIILGISMTKDAFDQVLRNNNVEVLIPNEGDEFDFNNHEVISQIENNEIKPGTILSLSQVGYKLNDRLLRAAKVVVSKLKD